MSPVCVSVFPVREESPGSVRSTSSGRSWPLSSRPRGPSQPEDSPPVWLLTAVTERDLPRLLLLLAHSTKEWINDQPAGSASPPRSALHAACHLGDVVMTQLLVWVGLSSLVLQLLTDSSMLIECKGSRVK